ncbi:hypothetical protein [Streptomyces sp. 4F14]|uniref:hypothetical protein n=1 Tax=Streptomyces sp. 4F14 TaxID=3394380 RepID=UPI003A89A7F0
MAHAELKAETTITETITLTLSRAEAEVIATVGAFLAGDVVASPRGDYRNVAQALQKAGIKVYDDPRRDHPMNLINLSTTNAICFRNKPGKTSATRAV